MLANEVEKLLDKIESLEYELNKLKVLYSKQTAEFEKAKKRYAYYEARFVEVCKDCSESDKAKCLMYPDYCEGDQCKELVDLENLLDKAIEKGMVV